jgi:hypothetical protein
MHNGFHDREKSGIGNPACAPVLGECAVIDGHNNMVQVKTSKDPEAAA